MNISMTNAVMDQQTAAMKDSSKDMSTGNGCSATIPMGIRAKQKQQNEL